MRAGVRQDVAMIMLAVESEMREHPTAFSEEEMLSIIGRTLFIMEASPRKSYLKFLMELRFITETSGQYQVDLDVWHAHELYAEVRPAVVQVASSQREQVTAIRGVMRELSKTADERGISVSDIYDLASHKDIAEDRTKTLLKRMAQNGEIYSPSPGFYKEAGQ